MKYPMLVRTAVWTFCGALAALASQPPEGMQTPWSERVDRVQPLPAYPRPMMQREAWLNLNGSWQYAIRPRSSEVPTTWDGSILVPFPLESPLSGVQKRVSPEEALWYRRTFSVSGRESSQRVLLHFGAVDWESSVFLNGKAVGRHQGGYTGFTIDITPYLIGEQEELVVRVWDPTDQAGQPRGKQVTRPGGIYYTPVSGIWQTVWCEVVPETHLTSYEVVTDVDASTLRIRPVIDRARPEDRLEVSVSLDDRRVVSRQFRLTEDVALILPEARLWSPETPVLYDLELSVVRGAAVVDRVQGYFGLREITLGADGEGVMRLRLNGEVLFQCGPLDQGYWPDGIYTAPTEEALVSDIRAMKAMGFNMVRKHVKVEPARWYYHCDRVGLLVWQDMPSGFGEIVPVKDHDRSLEGDWLARHYADVTRSYDSEKGFREELATIVRQLYNHPSIVVWVPFNESWGQFKTGEILDWVKEQDPTRLVDGPSGWIDRQTGDLRDYHLYGERLKAQLPLEEGRAVVIGEFGGLGYAVQGHLFSEESWSYQGFKSADELEGAYRQLIQRVAELKQQGYAAAIYTQLTDVETEINGLLTYDRKVMKIPAETLHAIHRLLY